MTRIDRSWLVRLWRDGEGERAWRASVRDLRGGSARTFRDLDEMVAFLVSTGPEADPAADSTAAAAPGAPADSADPTADPTADSTADSATELAAEAVTVTVAAPDVDEGPTEIS